MVFWSKTLYPVSFLNKKAIPIKKYLLLLSGIAIGSGSAREFCRGSWDMNIKSERLKKLETELEDLEQWMNLGLVPKKDVDKHREEIRSLKTKIEEEKERLRFMKESGDLEEYVTPKRSAARQAYAEPHTLPDMDGGENMTDAGLDMETESFEMETVAEEETESGGTGAATEEEGTPVEEEEDEDPFSDRNRWKRGILEDPDADNW